MDRRLIKKILKAWKDFSFLSTLSNLRELEEDEEDKYFLAKQTLEKYFDELYDQLRNQ